MADPTPPTPPAPQPGDGSNQQPGDFNQAQLETVAKSENLARSAAKPDYNPKLVGEGMDAGTPQALLDAADEWRRLSGEAVTATHKKEQATGAGIDAETALRREVEFFRGKARLAIAKHPEWKDGDIAAFKTRYFINQNIFATEALAGQSVKDILTHAGEDNLPGVTPTRIAAAQAVLDAYTKSGDPQTDEQSKATQLRAQRDAQFDIVLLKRREIQHAADTGWPWWDDQHLAIRREFLLPSGRAFTG